MSAIKQVAEFLLEKKEYPDGVKVWKGRLPRQRWQCVSSLTEWVAGWWTREDCKGAPRATWSVCLCGCVRAYTPHIHAGAHTHIKCIFLVKRLVYWSQKPFYFLILPRVLNSNKPILRENLLNPSFVSLYDLGQTILSGLCCKGLLWL